MPTLRKSTVEAPRAATREDVERALVDWLEVNRPQRNVLSAWESHCCALVLTFLRYGYYERALEQISFILEPPTPLPVFPLHHLMSLEQLMRALPLGARERLRLAASPTHQDEAAEPN